MSAKKSPAKKSPAKKSPLRCWAFLVPLLAVLGPLGLSCICDGRVWDLIPGWRPSEMPDLSGKVAIVTGPTMGGIGYETALELARKGAHVVLAGRSKQKGEAALAALRQELPQAKAEFGELDLSSLSSVKAFSEWFVAKDLPLHILVNNAGIMMNPFTLTEDGLESQFGTNHIGHYLLTKLLVPVLERSAPSRVVMVSSAAAYGPDILKTASLVTPEAWLPAKASDPIDFKEYLRSDAASYYNRAVAYGRSKLANVLHARGLARRLQNKKIYVNACHPGGIDTNLVLHVKSALGRTLTRILFAASSYIAMSPKQGAVTQLYLATSPEIEAKNITGEFYRPQAMKYSNVPNSVSDELEDQLWNLSEELVARFL